MLLSLFYSLLVWLQLFFVPSQGSLLVVPRIKKKVVILGGGVGGLVSSSILARNGAEVHVLEKQGQCGGRMDSDEICVGDSTNMYRFDRGPSLLLLPDVYTKTFALLGENLSDHVNLLPVEPLYRCYFEEDGTIAEISTDPSKMSATAMSIEGEGGYDSFVSYMKTAGDFLRFGLPTVIEEKPEWQHLGSFLMACIRAFPLLSHATMLQSFFRSAKMRALMSFQDLYIGLSPYEAPAVFALLQALELERGIYYPEGGFASVARALERIARKNHVNIETNCSIQAIHTSQNIIDSVTVVSTNGTQQHVHGDIFVTNIDAPEFEQAFVGTSNAAIQQDQQTANGRSSCGIISFNFAFNKELRCLSHHTLYLSKSYQSSWKVVEDPNGAKFDPQNVNFYVHAPSRTENNGTVCPIGHDSITVLVPVPPLPITTTTSTASTATLPGYDLAVCRAVVLQKLQEMEDAEWLRSGK